MRVLSGQPKPQYQVRAGDGPNGSQAAARRSVQPSANHEQALFRLDVRRSLQMHRRLALTIAILGIAAAALYLFTLWPVYTAQALVYVQPDPPKVMDQGTGMRWPFDANTYESFIQQQMLAVTRPDVMTGALKKLGPGPWIKNGESEQGAAERLRGWELATSFRLPLTPPIRQRPPSCPTPWPPATSRAPLARPGPATPSAWRCCGRSGTGCSASWAKTAPNSRR